MMKPWALMLALVVGMTARPSFAGDDDTPKKDEPYAADEDAESEPAKAEPPEDRPTKAPADEEAPPKEPPSEEAPPKEPPSEDAPPKERAPAKAPPSPTPAAPPHAPSPDPPGASTPAVRLHGAIVIARRPAARGDAKRLARAVYQDNLLRPTIGEAMAQVLVGKPAAQGQVQQAEVAAVVKTLDAVDDDGVRRRLLGSLARDLGAQLVVEVDHGSDATPRARVLKLPDERFLGVTLAPTKSGDAWLWTDSIVILRGLVTGPAPGPRTQPAGPTTPAAPVEEEGESDWGLLESPWFWGGLGVVVTVGVTVLILSQTALNDPDVVMVEGMVGP